ncbi:MAG: hypothetical protein LIP04_14375 [Tannerellaceae bacterium]|nr:hypothetical protein [Tannerellaceae bacterium]
MNTEKNMPTGKPENVSNQPSEKTKENIRETRQEKDPATIRENPDNISDPDVSSGVC